MNEPKMITMNELVDLRMQQHIAHEIYRQQIMQRIPDPFPAMLPVPIPRHIMLPPRVTLPGVEANLQNNDLWNQFHQIGTEMIITKSGRRMFPSMRLSVSGLEDDANYCVLLEMVPIGDCRYKFSGSQWVPAGGAEPQSPQRMYLHPDSPAQGSHWQAQPILFNKVKLTNNTLDNNGHIVLTSMHKYQPRIHIIRTSDPTQIPWAPQQAFVFPETEFVAVTAYQNDRITKLKIDNNPFAKGFRETGQSRCKRKMTTSESNSNSAGSAQSESSDSPTKNSEMSDDANFDLDNNNHGANVKRVRSSGSACSVSSLDDSAHSISGSSSGASSPANTADDPRLQHPVSMSVARNDLVLQQFHQNMQSLMQPSLVDLACSYFGRQPSYYSNHHMAGYYSPQIAETQPCNGSPVPADIAPIMSPPIISANNNNNSAVNNKDDSSPKVPRKASFTISAILGSDN